MGREIPMHTCKREIPMHTCTHTYTYIHGHTTSENLHRGPANCSVEQQPMCE